MISRLQFALACLGLWLGSTRVDNAAVVHIDKVVGGVWYAASQGGNEMQVRPDTDLAPGHFRTDSDGSFYASPAFGSTFRLAPGSELNLASNDSSTDRLQKEPISTVMYLLQGKISAGGHLGRARYHIIVKGGRVAAATGLSVVCVHGDGAHVFVAQGEATLYPVHGIYHVRGLILLARPTVAVLEDRGSLQLTPLISSAPGTFSCLTSGASPEIAGNVEHGFPSPVNIRRLTVSPFE